MKKIQPKPVAAKPVAVKPVPSFENFGPFDR
jgi:hypothetical protein